MYESYFKLQRRPFVAAPLAQNYVPSAAMEQARQTLVRCVERAEGPALIVGPAGSGKSLLCQLVAHHFREQHFQVAMLASARLSTRRALLQNILFELGLPYRGMEEGELRLSLIDHLEPRGTGTAGLLLVVDEAHTLPLRLLEEIRLISNFIRDGQPRVRLVLAGSAQLEERLASPKLESLQQRIAARCYLQPLNREETGQFILQQIQQAGGNAETLFPADALKAVFTATDGVPRLINQVCDHALVLSALGGHPQIGADAIEEAWADLQQLPAPWQQSSQSKTAVPATAVEFGQLSDDQATAAETPVEVRAAENMDRIAHGLGALDAADGIQFGSLGDALDDVLEFEPCGPDATQVELTFSTPANPFGDNFDEEEVVIDRYATLSAESPAAVWSKQDDVSELREQLQQLARGASEAADSATELPALSVREPLRVHAGRESFHPASDPVLPEEAGAPHRTSVPDRPKRREYRTLFSTLRSR